MNRIEDFIEYVKELLTEYEKVYTTDEYKKYKEEYRKLKIVKETFKSNNLEVPQEITDRIVELSVIVDKKYDKLDKTVIRAYKNFIKQMEE